ncbi:putative E3 ubiquitin-protein ligase ZNRF2 [Podospora fimiseda]|uniref:RING-type E3 ubiquitin transferase n=1 Tax=Podospora fimiseda TaxID=252190 RepID=A0AAN7BP47_9PEZI|nr:putative E3 ubiquitin-protein ligase ZNRF2 [Podospora fimiseda]
MDSAAGGQPQRLVEISSSSDSESASNASRSQGVSTICRWRTPRFHDQECSRYFDCPSHLVDRALSDAGDADNQDQEQHQDMDMGDEEDPDPGAVSSLSEDGDSYAGDRSPRPRSPSPELPATVERQPTQPGTNIDNPIVLSSSPVQSRRQIEPQPDSTSSRNVVAQERELPQAPQRPQLGASGATNVTGLSEIILPRWQPDAEATYCFICHTQFSIFVRKHHCRKCGRVVCASCSPHRITIPYQYIVQPPGASSSGFFSTTAIPPSPSTYPSFGGGASVRLCNPCVPDPNTAPPQTQTNLQGNVITPAQFLGLGSYFGASPSDSSNAHARSRSVTLVGNWATTLTACLPLSRDSTEFQPQPQHAGLPSSSRTPHQPYPQSTENRILSGTPPVYYPSSSTARRPRPYNGSTPYQSMVDFSNPGGSASVAGPSSSAHAHRRLPPLPNVQRQVAEEDECPVCHRELPPRSLSDFEARREAHINMCITSHSAYSGGVPANGSPNARGENPLPPVPPRRTGMFPYKATEKDCVDSAECTICLEEFEVGVAMARLECLCRFHRACIGAWWERHPGRCPMHQHDGFGY